MTPSPRGTPPNELTVIQVPWANQRAYQDVVARALYNHAISQPGCITAATWERAAPGVRAHHIQRAIVALAALDANVSPQAFDN